MSAGSRTKVHESSGNDNFHSPQLLVLEPLMLFLYSPYRSFVLNESETRLAGVSRLRHTSLLHWHSPLPLSRSNLTHLLTLLPESTNPPLCPSLLLSFYSSHHDAQGLPAQRSGSCEFRNQPCSVVNGACQRGDFAMDLYDATS